VVADVDRVDQGLHAGEVRIGRFLDEAAIGQPA